MMVGGKHEGPWEVVAVTVIALVVSVLSVYVHFSRAIYVFFVSAYPPAVFESLVNFIFLYLAGLLYIVYKKWKRAHSTEQELERVISSISPDALIVIDGDRNITLCNPSVERMFGYRPDEILNKKTDFLYSDRRTSPVKHHEIRDALEREGFHVGFASGKKRDETGITLEIITAHLKERPGAVLLLRDITGSVRAEDEQKESQRRLQSIFENASEGIFQSTPEGRYLSVNPAHARMHGYSSPAELMEAVIDIGKLYVDPQDRDRLKERLEKDGKVENFESRRYRRDGGTFWVSTNARVIDDAFGRTLYYEGTVEDITARKEAEKALTESELKYRTLFESANDAIFLMEEEFFIDCNQKTLDMFHCTRDQIIGKPPYIFSPPLQPDGRDSKEGALDRIRAAMAGRPQFFEWRHCWHDGTPFDAEVSLNTVTLGKETFLQAIVRDINKRKEAEEALQKSERKFRSIFENAVEGIYQTTPDGRFLSVNPAFARMIGYDSPEEVIEKITDVARQGYVTPQDRDRFKEELQARGMTEGFEIEHYRKDGSKIWVSINARAVKDEEGRVLYYEGTMEDITSRKRAKEQLKLSTEKLRKSLAGTIQAMSLTVETRDPYTAGHQKRVSQLARTIAQAMGLSEEKVDAVRMAGAIHDIGKMAVPAEILSKPTALTDAEARLIRVHPQSGYDILKDSELPHSIADIILQHHERLDGSGYPQGLKGAEILLEACILAVADVVEAISSHRPYRPAHGIAKALEEIESNAGILYDPDAAKVCLNLFRQQGFTFDK
jgi:PAS domain S-box-containing protein/putative nucleotidyltransferase with HDIG domain